QIDYAKELNAQQHAAVTAPPGPALVIAGAGSGKTRTLIYRVAYLLEQGIPAERILLLTFTNKAAREMMRRVADLLGTELSTLWGGTFHSIGNRVLRRHARLLGYQPDFTIMDREDAKDLLQACVDEMQIDVKATRFPKADVLGDIFSLASNKEKSIQEILQEQFPYFSELSEQIAQVQVKYLARKRSTNAMDFDDLLLLWVKLLKDHAEVREDYQRRFQFVLVDEYQDTNKIQGELIDLLVARHKNIMAVGDDSQSIYSWRGAHFQNIVNFPERYPAAKLYRIETNYRSTPEILELANAAIAANANQFEKHLTSARKSGAKPVMVMCDTGDQQAAFVAQRMLELRDEGTPLNNMAVLYRSHFHALELQMELTRRNIPFSITSGIRFFEQAHVKDVAAYLKLVTNPHDELSFKRIVRLLPGIGGKTADKLWACFNSNIDAALAAGTKPLATALQKCTASVPKRSAVAWAQLMATAAQLENPDIRASASRMIQLVLDAGYDEYLKERYPNFQDRREDLDRLAAYAQRFQTIEEFLAQLALQTSVEEAEETEARTNDDEMVRLSTIHQSKGLEFDVVFIIMLCDGLFPSSRSAESLEGEEEERRLFYVAITRARNELYLTYPFLRRGSHPGEEIHQRPSRFLGELPKEMLDEWNLRAYS
ncbi:MAG: ATP-dependent helicase, partial [Limisphaerales bacterium]